MMNRMEYVDATVVFSNKKNRVANDDRDSVLLYRL